MGYPPNFDGRACDLRFGSEPTAESRKAEFHNKLEKIVDRFLLDSYRDLCDDFNLDFDQHPELAAMYTHLPSLTEREHRVRRDLICEALSELVDHDSFRDAASCARLKKGWWADV